MESTSKEQKPKKYKGRSKTTKTGFPAPVRSDW